MACINWSFSNKEMKRGEHINGLSEKTQRKMFENQMNDCVSVYAHRENIKLHYTITA